MDESFYEYIINFLGIYLLTKKFHAYIDVANFVVRTMLVQNPNNTID
jgi:hypothetical protein